MSTPVIQKTIRFFTDTGIEVPAVTADQMRQVDRIATEETGPLPAQDPPDYRMNAQTMK